MNLPPSRLFGIHNQKFLRNEKLGGSMMFKGNENEQN
jgi:hypothetical protein